MSAAPAEASSRRVMRAGLPVLTWPVLEQHGADVVVTTRHGGVSRGPYATLNLGLHVGDDASAVVENRRRAAAAVGVDLDDLVFGEQCHGATAAVVGTGDRGRGARGGDALPATDALVTAEPGVGLAIMVADCVPIALLDPVRRVVAAVHAGWRGTVADIVGAALARMVEAGTDPADVLAGLGPTIPAADYEVGADVVAAVEGCLGSAASEVLQPVGEGRYRLDLWTANRLLLERRGVARDRVLVAPEATGAGTDFFSARAQRPCGRFALLVRLHG